LPTDTRKRLQIIEQFSDLGSGFQIAMRDLDIRGAGNLLGGEQSGFIADIGYDMYHKILDETIRELRQNQFKEVYQEQLEREENYVKDVQVDTDMELHIPDEYVRSVSERLTLYTELNNIKEESTLQAFKIGLVDRFGPLPREVNELFHAIRLQWAAQKLGIERIVLKDKVMKCYFVDDQQSYYYESALFGRILQFVQQRPREFQLKQTPRNLLLIMPNIRSISEANKRMYEMQQEVVPVKE
jgi:transcription-repair coupling factor (superfamily II helicase)